MRNGSLWNRHNVVFEKEVNFHQFDFKTSVLEFEVSKSSIWKHTTSCDKGGFSFIIIFDNRLSSNFHRYVVLCICWDTASEQTSLWQLPIVSSVYTKCLVFHIVIHTQVVHELHKSFIHSEEAAWKPNIYTENTNAHVWVLVNKFQCWMICIIGLLK